MEEREDQIRGDCGYVGQTVLRRGMGQSKGNARRMRKRIGA